MDIERLINTFLDGKFATMEAKKELAIELDIKVDNIVGFELLSDELQLHQAIAVTLNDCILTSESLKNIDYEYITVNDCGKLVLVIYDEPK